MGVIRYSARLGACRVLGPGTRAVLWVHGCCFSCPGCIGERFRDGTYEQASPAELARWYLAQGADGLTISGGEPMLQAAGLSEMVRLIRAEADCGVIAYTGFLLEDLRDRAEHDAGVAAFLEDVDLLIDGPYVDELNDNRPYRGSSNQRILPLTERYADAVEDYYGGSASREIEIHLSERGTLMAGVPGREQALIWQKVKRLGDGDGV